MISEFDKEFAFLSNFYPSPITVWGMSFPTVEHFFQAAKTTNVDEMKKIASAATPGQAKRLGRAAILRPDWDNIKIDIMRMGLEEKFKDPVLRAKLLDTGDKILVEGNWWHDNTWGDCKCEKCSRVLGHNILGKLLMEIRTKEQLGN